MNAPAQSVTNKLGPLIGVTISTGAFVYWCLIDPNPIFCTFVLVYSLLINGFIYFVKLRHGMSQDLPWESNYSRQDLGIVQIAGDNFDNAISNKASEKLKLFLYSLTDIAIVPANILRGALLVLITPMRHWNSVFVAHYVPNYVIVSSSVLGVGILLFFNYPDHVLVVGGVLEFLYYLFPFYAIFVFIVFGQNFEANKLIARFHPNVTIILTVLLFALGALLSNASIAMDAESVSLMEFLRTNVMDTIRSLPGRIQAVGDIYASIPDLLNGTLTVSEKQDLHLIALLSFVIGGLGLKGLTRSFTARTDTAQLEAVIHLVNDGRIRRARKYAKRIKPQSAVAHSVLASVYFHDNDFESFKQQLMLSSQAAFYDTHQKDPDAHNFAVLCNFIGGLLKKDRSPVILSVHYNDFIRDPSYLCVMLFFVFSVSPRPPKSKSISAEEANEKLSNWINQIGYSTPSPSLENFYDWRERGYNDADAFGSEDADQPALICIALRLVALLVLQQQITAYRSEVDQAGLKIAELANKIPRYCERLFRRVEPLETAQQAIFATLVLQALEKANTPYVAQLRDRYVSVSERANALIRIDKGASRRS
ncbi:MAG: hypothetical protein AAF465_06745 [Pseudomonadota bacterium]